MSASVKRFHVYALYFITNSRTHTQTREYKKRGNGKNNFCIYVKNAIIYIYIYFCAFFTLTLCRAVCGICVCVRVRVV